MGPYLALCPFLRLMNLAKRNPEAYAAAPFKLPRWAMKVLPPTALLIYAYGIYFSWDYIGTKAAVILLAYAGLAAAYAFWREPVVKMTMDTDQGGQKLSE